MGIRSDTYCGLNCGACPVGMANDVGDLDELKSMAESWDRTPEELLCSGCKSEVTATFCTSRHMRECARDKGLEFCVDCADFPCEIITAFRNDDASHHSAVLSNLEMIGEIGVEAWLAAEAVRWSCPGCGKRFHWYTESCPGCGTELYSAVSEEKDLDI